MRLRQRDIVLIPVPFTDLTSLSSLNEGLFFALPTPRIDMTSSLPITVQVPLLPTAVLLLSALGGIGLLRFRKRGHHNYY